MALRPSIPFSSDSHRWCYDVYLSYERESGSDLATILYAFLERYSIKTFKGDGHMERGAHLSPTLTKGITKSRIAVIIYSRNYAYSTRCLEENALIINCRNKFGQLVLPVFLMGVEGSHVRRQKGCFEEPFRLHQELFKPEIVDKWRATLTNTGEICGWNIQDLPVSERHEIALSRKIVNELSTKMMISPIAHREIMDFSYRRGMGMTTEFRRQTISSYDKRLKLSAFSFRATYKVPRPFDIFINHRGLDTKRNIAALLHERFTFLGLNPFLDEKSMVPGEELEKVIKTAIRDCKVGVAIISPNYCTSDNCLEELAILCEHEKKVIPIFFDVQVSNLVVKGDESFSAKQLYRFRWALDFAKDKVGIVFDSSKQNWVELISRVSEIVMGIINKDREIEEIDYYPHRLLG